MLLFTDYFHLLRFECSRSIVVGVLVWVWIAFWAIIAIKKKLKHTLMLLKMYMHSRKTARIVCDCVFVCVCVCVRKQYTRTSANKPTEQKRNTHTWRESGAQNTIVEYTMFFFLFLLLSALLSAPICVSSLWFGSQYEACRYRIVLVTRITTLCKPDVRSTDFTRFCFTHSTCTVSISTSLFF